MNFLEKHFSHDCVKGSLSCCNESTDDYIQDILSCKDEVIAYVVHSAVIDHNVQTNLNVKTLNDHEVPMKLSVCVKPLAKK